VSVIDATEHNVVGTIELPKGDDTSPLKPKGIVVSPDAKTIYVATGRGNSVAVIDAQSQKLVQLIPVGQRPWGLELSPDGRKLYVANSLSNNVSVIDVATKQVIATIAVGDGPWTIAIRPGVNK